MTRQAPSLSGKASRPFTGWHMAAILVGFFGVVIAVNLLMARLATGTFGAVVVDNSYVASQHFNTWLRQASEQKALGWNGDLSRDSAGRATIRLTDRAGKPIAGARISATAEHPLGQRPSKTVALHEVAPGLYAASLDPGRWRLRVAVTASGRTWRMVGDVL